MLIDRGCDAVQGYYICKPNEASVIDEWLASFPSLPRSLSRV